MAEKMEFPLQLKRQYSGSLVADEVFSNEEERLAYLSNPLRYAGQVVCQANTSKLYVINNTLDGYVKVGGDGGSNALVYTREQWESIDKTDIEDGAIINLTEDTIGSQPRDIFSEDETLTNKVWIDGKPIYRRVVKGLNWTSNEWNKTILSKITVSEMDSIINVIGVLPNRCVSCFQFDKSDGICAISSTEVSNNGKVIIEYTKTTDTP